MLPSSHFQFNTQPFIPKTIKGHTQALCFWVFHYLRKKTITILTDIT